MEIKTFVVGYVSTNCYIVYDASGDAAIIDPGDSVEKLTEFLHEQELKLKYIFLTHGHFDHIMAVPALKAATGAKIVIAAGDADCLTNPARSLSGSVRMRQLPAVADALAEDGDTFAVGDMTFTYLLTPGHTPGCAVILCGGAMFSGDTLFEDDCGRCDLPGGDYEAMLRSLKRLHDLPGDYDVYPGHDVKNHPVARTQAQCQHAASYRERKMKLYLIGHTHRYAIEQAAVGLLGRTSEFCGGALPGGQLPDGDVLVSKLSYGKKYGTASAVLRLGDQVVRATSRAERVAADDTDGRIRSEQHALKLAVFKAVRAATGESYPWGSLTGMRPSKLALGFLEDGMSPETVKRHLTGRYMLQPSRARLVTQAAEYGYNTKRRFGSGDISLYVGIPFCPSRCSYCSFVSSETGRSGHLIEPYLDTLTEEIRLRGELVAALGLNVATVYIGGGTPTSLSASQLDRLMSALGRAFPLGKIAEYTVEAGRPDTITPEKLRVIRDHGAGRISINPQSMIAEVLERCGRPHTPEDIRRAYEQARRVGFDCINMDTIAGLPGDTPEGFRKTLTELVALAPENITVHTLALKRGAGLKTEQGREADPGSSAADVLSMLDFSVNTLYNNGYIPYYLYRQKYMAAALENTGWTVGGRESLYNICIMDEFQTILSLGAGGVTKLVGGSGQTIERIANNKYPKEYIGSLEKIIADGEKFRSFYR